MAQDVVDRPKSIIGTSEITSEKRMKTFGAGSRGAHLKQPLVSYGVDQLMIACIRIREVGKGDLNGSRAIGIGERTEEAIRLFLQGFVCGDHLRISTTVGGLREGRRNCLGFHRIQSIAIGRLFT